MRALMVCSNHVSLHHYLCSAKEAVLPGICPSVSNFTRKNYQIDLYKNFTRDVSVDKEELIQLLLDLLTF